jgi:transcriptional regulator with XRE-family HTH domain
MKKTKLSALQTIRSATGMTVRQFGALVGVSDALVTQMEHGKRSVTPAIAAAIMAATGADSDALRQGKARCLRGRPYNRESFADWCEVGGGEEVVAKVADRAAEMVRALVMASAVDTEGRRTPGRFHAVSLKLSMALDEMAGAAGLRDAASAQMMQRATQHETKTVSVERAAELYERSRSWPDIAKRIGRLQKVEVCEVTAPAWRRLCGRVELPDGTTAYGEAAFADLVSATVRVPGSSSKAMTVAPFGRTSDVVWLRGGVEVKRLEMPRPSRRP